MSGVEKVKQITVFASLKYIAHTFVFIGRSGAPLTAVPVHLDSPPVNGCSGANPTREILLTRSDTAVARLAAALERSAAQCGAAHKRGGGPLISEEKFQLTQQSLQLVTSSKALVVALSASTTENTAVAPSEDGANASSLSENLAVCVGLLRRLASLCADMADHATAPLQTRNLIMKVRYRYDCLSYGTGGSQSTFYVHTFSFRD
nr:unnamed protein product [Callosobruchus analis]